MNDDATWIESDVSGEAAARRELAARNRELAVLNEIGMALSSTLDLDTLAGRIHEQAGRIMNTFNLYVAMHDRERDTISFPVRIEGHQRLPDLPPRAYANGLTEYVLRTRQPLLLNGDVVAQARGLGLDPVGRPARSWMAAPLLAEGRAIGVIALQDHDGTGGYDQHDLDVLTVIAGQAAAAIRNARLLAEARGAYRELSEAHASRLEAERLRGVTETVGALNHEINNPLAAIAGNAQLLLRRPETLPDGTESKVQRILEAAHRIQAVTARMANLIHATSMSYPGDEAILDVSRSRAREATEPADGDPGPGLAGPPPEADAGA